MTDDKKIFKEVEKLIKKGKIDEAEGMLSHVQAHTAEYYYLLSETNYFKGWTNECRKNLEKAMELDPENEGYKAVYDKIMNGAQPSGMNGEEQATPFKTRRQMGWSDGCLEVCVEGGCMCCAEGICEGICDGC